MMHENDFIRIS